MKEIISDAQPSVFNTSFRQENLVKAYRWSNYLFFTESSDALRLISLKTFDVKNGTSEFVFWKYSKSKS